MFSIRDEIGENVVKEFGQYGIDPREGGEYVEVVVYRLPSPEDEEKLESIIPTGWSLRWKQNGEIIRFEK